MQKNRLGNFPTRFIIEPQKLACHKSLKNGRFLIGYFSFVMIR